MKIHNFYSNILHKKLSGKQNLPNGSLRLINGEIREMNGTAGFPAYCKGLELIAMTTGMFCSVPSSDFLFLLRDCLPLITSLHKYPE